MVRIEEELVSSFKSEQQKAMLNILLTETIPAIDALEKAHGARRIGRLDF